MATAYRLPERFERVVVVGGVSSYGAICGASLALSPLLHPHLEVVLTSAITTATATVGESGQITATRAEQPSAHDAQLRREAADTLAAARAEVIRSRTERGSDGMNPAPAPSDPVPLQFYLGAQHPTTPREVARLLSRVHIHGGDGTRADVCEPLTVRPDRDVLMCILNADVQASLTHATPHDSVVGQMVRVISAPAAAPACVLVVCDERSAHALRPLAEAAAAAPSAVLVVLRTRELSPPALEYALTRVAVRQGRPGVLGGGGGMLPTLCAGMLLGLVPPLPVYRHTQTPFVPVDVAVNTALCQAIRQLTQPLGGSAVSAAARSVVTALDPRVVPGTMVWGMWAEYMLDYYGRYAAWIRAAFPVKGLLPHESPSLHFLLSTADVTSYGLDAFTPACVTARRAADTHRRRLELTASSAWDVPVLIAAVRGAVDRVAPTKGSRGASLGLSADLQAQIPGLAPTAAAQQGGFGDSAAPLSPLAAALTAPLPTAHTAGYPATATYPQLLAALAGDPATVPLLQYTSLAELDWDMYVRHVARLVLQSLALRAAAGATPPSVAAAAPAFPAPTRIFVNDIVFAEGMRAPPSWSPCRRALGTVHWVYQAGIKANGYRALMAPGYTPQRMTELLALPHIEKVIDNTAARTSTSREEVIRRAKQILLRIGDTQNQLQCRTLGLVINRIFNKVIDRIEINSGVLERLRRLAALPRTSLVYIPLHRSYLDFLVVSYMLVLMGLSPPHVVAGEDFLRLGKISELMRGSGAFFMRRSFRGDPLYGALFKEYVAQMVTSGMPVEFFIEGTRSRTGKTMTPKMGILKFVTDAFLAEGQRSLDDVLFIPVSLSYDEQMEGKLYADELLGIPKPKESVPNMIRAGFGISRKYGNMHVHVGDAISLKQVRANPFECPVPFQPKEVKPDKATVAEPAPAPPTLTGAVARATSLATTTTPQGLLTSLAWRITYELQRNVVITAPALVAAALETLMPPCQRRGEALARSQVVAVTARLARAVQLRGGNLLRCLRSPDLPGGRTEGEAAAGAAAGAGVVEWSRVVTEAMGHLARFARVEQSAARGEAVVVYHPPTVASRIGVSISTNQLIHVFVDEAVVAVAAHAFGDGVGAAEAKAGPRQVPLAMSVRTEVLVGATRRLRRLLSTEFPNFSAFSPCSEDSWMQYALSRLSLGEEERAALAACRRLQPGSVVGGSAAARSSEAALVPRTAHYDFLLHLLLPHVEALYTVVLTALACLEENALSHGEPRPVLVRHMVLVAHKAAQRLFEENHLDYVVACNKETIAHYFQSLVEERLLAVQAVADLGPAYVLGEASAAPAPSARARTDPRRAQGPHERRQRLAGLESLLGWLQTLRWHPSTDPQEDVGIAKRAILTCYHAVSRGAKL